MEAIVLSILGVFSLLLLVMMLTELLNFVQTRVPFVPTSRADLVHLAERVGITQEDYVYDLGSGNGKVVFAVEQLTGASTKGFQRSGWTQWYAQLKKYFTRSKTQLVTGDFFNYPWSEATVIYAYLYPFLMRSVGEKILTDCSPGTKVVIRDFPLPNIALAESWETPSGHTMYLYIV
jgi:hypothetical protein